MYIISSEEKLEIIANSLRNNVSLLISNFLINSWYNSWYNTRAVISDLPPQFEAIWKCWLREIREEILIQNCDRELRIPGNTNKPYFTIEITKSGIIGNNRRISMKNNREKKL